MLFGSSIRNGSVLVLVAAAGGPERVLTAVPAPRSGRGLSGGVTAWLPDGSGVVYAAVDGHVWCQPLGAEDPWCITGDVPGLSPDRPAQAVDVSVSGDVAFVIDMAEVWVVAAGDGGVHRVDDGRDAFVADPSWSPDGRRLAWQAWSPPSMAWDHSAVVVVDTSSGAAARHDSPGVQRQQPRFAPDGSLLTVADSGGWLNLHRDDAPMVAEPHEHAGPTWGVGQRSFVVSPDGRHVAFSRNEDGFGRLCVVETSSGAVTDIAKAVHGHLDWRGDTLVALRTGGRTPTQIVVYDMSDLAAGSGTAPTRRTLAVGPVAAWDDDPALVEPELLRVDHDGVVLHARLYRSPGDSGRVICWVHGGPTDQWPVTFMPRIAYWVSRGWSVLVPDHRGSTGHGRSYQQAMSGRWGDLDVADTVALIEHVHLIGVGRPAGTAMMGSSAGGLTALGVVARRPDLVACAAAAYPVSDIGALDDTTHRFEAHYNDTLIGPRSDPAAQRARRDRSPVAAADRLAAVPLLVLHGDADPVVPVEQSRRLADAVRAAGGIVELVVYEGEGHGFRRVENQLDEYGRVTAFVAQYAAQQQDG